MKITFIRPNMLAKRTGSAIQPLVFAILKALTPKDVILEFYDEFIEDIPDHIETDLIAMTVQTFTAFRAYQLADKFRRQNIPVVMGGYHPSLLPDEAIRHADAVAIGDAERIWPQIVNDARNGYLKQFYEDRSLASLQGIYYDRSIFFGKKYSKIVSVEFNRGCKYACDFCSVCVVNHHRVKSRPIHEIIEELGLLKNKYVSFVDDNFCIDKDATIELLEAMIPLKKKWGCQISLDALSDEAFLELMAKSGCVAVMVGFESLNTQNLEKMKKKANLREDYIGLIHKVKKYGIMIWGSFVFGYDHDDNVTIKKTYDFATENKLYLANFNTLSPLPGTGLYQRMEQENRLISDNWWLSDKFKYGEIMFQPKKITIEDLRTECVKIRLNFNKLSNITYRAFDRKSNCRNLSNLTLYVVSNIMGRGMINNLMKEIRPD